MTAQPRQSLLALALALAAGLAAACAPSAAPPAPAKPTSAPASPVAAAAAAPTAAASASQPSAAAAAPATLQKVRYGDLKILAEAATYIGINEGFFAEQGIEVELTTFDSAANMVAPLATNQIDTGGGALSAGLYNAFRSGVNVRIVADKGHNDPTPPGFPQSNFMVRRALVESGQVRSAADLRGLRYASPAPGISPELDLAAFLREGGLTIRDLDVTHMSFPDMVAAFANESIDAAPPVEPFATTILGQGTAVLLKRDYEVNPGHQVAVLFYSPEFSRSELAPRFMVGYLRGARLYNDAFLKNNAAAREKAIAAMIQHTPVKNRALYDQMALSALHPDGQMNLQSFEQQQDYFLAAGLQQGRVDLQSFIDLQHAQAAVRQLGPYQR